MSDAGREGIYLVRFRSRVGAVRVEEVRAAAWPAERLLMQGLGYFAEEAWLVREEPRREVAFPRSLYTLVPPDPVWIERLRQAARDFEESAAMAEGRPRPAEQALVALGPSFEALGAEVAAAMWTEAAAVFATLGDDERAGRMLGRLAALGRRTKVSARRLATAALPAVEGGPFHEGLLEVAVARLVAEGQEEVALGLRIAAMERLAGAGARLPAGSVAALVAAARGDGARVAAALLRLGGVPGIWGDGGGTEALQVRACVGALWARASEALRTAIWARLGAAVPALDAAGRAAMVEMLLAAHREGADPRPLLEAALALLEALGSEVPERARAEDVAAAALIRVAREAGAIIRARADALAAAVKAARPFGEAFCAALVADLDALAGLRAEGRSASRSAGEADTAPATAGCLRTELVRALGRWIPGTRMAAVRAALAGGALPASLDPRVASDASVFPVAVRLVGLAQDERTPEALARAALALAAAMHARLKPGASPPRTAPRTLHPDDVAAPSAPELDALREGIAWTQARFGDRGSLRPLRWPAPAVPGLSDPRHARFVLLACALGRLTAREVGSSHLIFARVAAEVPFVRAEPGCLVRVPARKSVGAGTLPGLAAVGLVRTPMGTEASLTDVVVLCDPGRLADALALDLGLAPVAATATATASVSATATASATAAASLEGLPLPDPDDVLQPDRAAENPLAALATPAADPLPVPGPDPSLPLSPRIAGHDLALGEDGGLHVMNARGEPLRRIPDAVRKHEDYRALIRGRRDDRSREARVRRAVEERMTSALPLAPGELGRWLADPVRAALLRHLVVAPADEHAVHLDQAGLLWAWDAQRGLGVVPLDYDARWIGWRGVEIVHPCRLHDLPAWQALARDLDLRQRVPQLFRELPALPPAPKGATEVAWLGGRTTRSAAAIRRALAEEEFLVRPSRARASFVHRELPRPVEARFDPGRAPSPADPTITGALSFYTDEQGPLAIDELPVPIVAEAVVRVERALARAALPGR